MYEEDVHYMVMMYRYWETYENLAVYMINLYMNDLIGELSSTKVGCSIEGVMINNISYADDMVLLSPSINGLTRLLAVCESYAETHGLRYNTKKTQCESGSRTKGSVAAKLQLNQPISKTIRDTLIKPKIVERVN